MTKLALSQLPDELLLKILHCLSAIELLSIAKVSARFERLVQNPSLWEEKCLRFTNSGITEFQAVNGARSQIHCMRIDFRNFQNSPQHNLISKCFSHVQKVRFDSLFGESEIIFQLPLLLSCFPKLKQLDLSECRKLASYESMRSIAFSCPNLTHVKLRKCLYLQDRALEALVRALPNLVHLDLSYCSRITDAGIGYLFSGTIAKQWRHLYLETMNLDGEQWKRVIQKLAKRRREYLTSLSMLNLKGNMSLGAEALKSLASIHTISKPTIRIDVKDCEQLTTADLSAITNLDSALQFRHNCKLEDYSVEAIKSYVNSIVAGSKP